MRRLPAFIVTFLVVLCPPLVRAEVKDASATGFTIVNSTTIAVSPSRVWTALIDVGSWWNSEHTWSGSAKNLSIDPRPDGCFCEKLEKGGGVRHLSVAYVAPGQMLRMTGGLGPLQGLAVAGVMTWTLKGEGAGTTLEFTYAVGGYRPGGLVDLAPVVDGVLREQLLRLKALVETGRPDGSGRKD